MTIGTSRGQGSSGLTNIGPRERQVRNVLGYVLLAAGVALAIILLGTDTSRWWRLLLVIPAYQGLRFLYDARTGICPLKAELGQENQTGLITTIGQPIADSTRAGQIRSLSRRVMFRSVFGAILFAVIMLAIP